MAAKTMKDVVQIGLITGDLDRAVRTWEEKYGVGPWYIGSRDASNMTDTTLHGEPATFGMRIGVAWIGAMMIELIEPTGGESIYTESLARHGGADHLHHILCTSDDFQETLEALAGKGVATAQSGRMTEGPVDWAYLDTEDDLGLVLELARLPEGMDLRIEPPS